MDRKEVKMNWKYTLGVLIAVPLLPLLYVQGRKVKKRVPDLPEAASPSGISVPESIARDPMQLIILGESTMAGVGVNSHEEGFAGALARDLSEKLQCQIDWKVYAKSGYTAKDVTEKILPEIKEDSPNLIVIGLGGNDSFDLNSPAGWRRDIVLLINTLKQRFHSVPLVFANMPPIKEFPAFTPLIRFILGNLVEILGEELHRVVKKFDSVYYQNQVITLEEWMQSIHKEVKPSDFFSDGVHPSKLTYQTWAKDLGELITREVIPFVK